MTLEDKLASMLATLEDMKAEIIKLIEENTDIKDQPQIKNVMKVHEHINGAILRLYKAIGDNK